MKKIILSLSIAAFMFGACQKESEPEKKLPEGGGTQTNTTEQGTASGTLSVKPLTPITVQAEVGGANQPNQVYIDLSTGKATAIKRDTWHLAFYCGDDDFRVLINPAIAMSALEQETTDINKRVEEDKTILLNTDPTNPSPNHLVSRRLIDDPRGYLAPRDNEPGSGTAIAGVSAKDEENKVYLLSMGFAISDKTPVKGSVNILGAHKGWGKIRVLRENGKYKVMFVPRTAATAPAAVKTFTVAKNAAYNFVYLNLESGQMVQVEPKKNDWDLCYTAAVAWITNKDYDARSNVTLYPDLIINNIHGGTKVAHTKQFETTEKAYEAYQKIPLNIFWDTTVKGANFDANSYNRLGLGKSWRDLPNGGTIRPYWYVVRDGEGNHFKLIVRAMKNDAGERGYPTIEYQYVPKR